ncbi:hypothetical protein PT974_04324 [Cladobotryum mycophilum]|uniref:Clr5 domain-containing protein n=1 Tax=Cladobotryum mycophilum TaxID=491253 RepID=A0ABR0SUQ6_9HYPO
MFNQPQDRSRAGAFDGDSFGFANQSWGRFGFDGQSSQSMDPSQSMHGPERTFDSSSAMDWTPDLDSGFHQHGDGDVMSSADDIKLENLNPVQTGGGVGRLVAHFENRNYAPPLPPRPINTQANTFGSSPSMSSHFGSLNSMTHTNRVASPITNSSDSQYGSLGVHSPATSPIATSQPGMSYGSFHDVQQVHSPAIGSSCSPFGSLDEFMNPNRVNGSMAQHSMAPSSMMMTPSQPTPGVPGTPGFEIWRPPASMTIKTEPPSSPPTSFILEFNPAVKAKAKPPAKPPRPRLPPRKPIIAQASTSAGTATHMPAVVSTPAPATTTMSPPPIPTPRPLEAFSSPIPLPVPRQDNAALRAQAGARPSREQVPAEAWEQYKTTIRSLYLEERKPLKEVMSVMAEKYGFQATPKMYKTRFSQWGFVKNNTEDEVKRLLSMKFQRDAEGKVSEFVRNGRVVNLGTYLKRKGVTEYDLVDFELPADLPAHIRCRTPTPPPALKSPDLLRAQELVVGNMRKAFLHCRQFEVETDSQVGWPSTMHWGAWSSELLLEANFFFEARDADQGGDYLMRAFKQLEMDLRKLSPQGIMELILGMINRDPGMMTALCKYLAAYSATNLDRSHPLRQIFSCLYEVQQKHGASTLSELLWGCISSIAEELEAIYGRRHPYVARTWADLGLFYNQVNAERLDKFVMELRALQRQLEQQHGASSVEVVSLRYAILQLLYCASPHSDATKQAATDMWNLLRKMGVIFPVRDSRPNSYCYHSVVKVDPYTKRCRRRYDSGMAILEEHVGVKVHPYFEEDFHTAEHAPEPQDVWATALQQQMGPTRHWGLI